MWKLSSLIFLSIQLCYRIQCKDADTQTALPKYYVGINAKNPIFGSFAFDPIYHVFNPPLKSDDQNQIVNSSFILSTAVGWSETPIDKDKETTASMRQGKRQFLNPSLSIKKPNLLPHKWWEKPEKDVL